MQSFLNPDNTDVRSEILYIICTFFLHKRKKKTNSVEMCSYPELSIPGYHPAALMSAFSSAFWVLLRTCQHLVMASWCVGYHRTLRSSQLSSKNTPQNPSQVLYIYIYIYITHTPTGKKNEATFKKCSALKWVPLVNAAVSPHPFQSCKVLSIVV